MSILLLIVLIVLAAFWLEALARGAVLLVKLIAIGFVIMWLLEHGLLK